ncbi:heparan-alpha-glucosaminide N-acetyltransferase-like isoform X3 [Olea europaea var. sylvestris]|uniref:Heparan-alpha-glucosaminide N-acetyltransferase-like isoform X1 n=1 Tax=Olea europaea subsp. europaea TaxID=158383 RepID=A0A8S0RI97_OLEEU|nr:heparan-alpha-glucosaminide N-acetyltransferase-like isoform X3 [Olea europaea var. sylvestris]CAA2979034.1 heparan-alpha-glucosaminide N-acetyltransferase-like isoform X1 [Olea europaea subsp. europaea]
MASIVVVTDTDGGDRTPLLQNSQPEDSRGDVTVRDGETVYSTAPVEELPDKSESNISTDPKQRLVSLDVFRGITIALMILVDDAGKAFPSINHAPWFGVTIADFVMPFFLFGVGVSVSLVFKKVPNKSAATKKVILRTIKLFLLGVILQGGYFHGRGHLTYGVDVEKIRLMGVLQRIAIGYLLASLLEIWLINNTVVDSAVAFVKRYSFQLAAGILLGLLYMILLYGLYVPNWTFEVSTLSITSSLFGVGTQTVQCGVRSSLEPPCNAVGFLDRFLLGEHHLYQRPVYRRTKECSVNSPDYGPLPPNSPAWCLAPFDPEGILSSMMAAITCLIGLHYGHILVHCKDQMQRVILWSILSLPLLIVGYLLNVVGVPFSKPLYTLSYMFITAGASGIFLTIIFYLVDVKCIRKPMVIFQWMGMNALIIYALAASDVFPEALQGLYWRSPENNLVDFSERLWQTLLHSEKWGTLAFVMVEILFWGLVAGFLHKKRVYIKI